MREQVLGEKVALWLSLNGVGAAAAIAAGVQWYVFALVSVGLPLLLAFAGRIFGAAVARATIAESEKYGAEEIIKVTEEDMAWAKEYLDEAED